MEKITLKSKEYIDIEKTIKDEIITNFAFDKNYYFKSSGEVQHRQIIYILENYSFRINSNITFSLIVTEDNDSTEVEIIVSAGTVCGLTCYGVEKSRIKKLKDIFVNIGFEEVTDQ